MHAAAQLSAYTAQNLSQGMVPPTMGRCFHLSLSKLNPHRHAKGPIFQGLSTFYNLTLPITEGEIRRRQGLTLPSPLEFILQAQLSSTKEKGFTQGIPAVTMDTQESELPYIQGKKSFGGSPV